MPCLSTKHVYAVRWTRYLTASLSIISILPPVFLPKCLSVFSCILLSYRQSSLANTASVHISSIFSKLRHSSKVSSISVPIKRHISSLGIATFYLFYGVNAVAFARLYAAPYRTLGHYQYTGVIIDAISSLSSSGEDVASASHFMRRNASRNYYKPVDFQLLNTVFL